MPDDPVRSLAFNVIHSVDRAPRESRWPRTRAEALFNHQTPTQGLVCAVVTVDPGAVIAMHYHTVETIEYVTTGKARVRDQYGNAVVVTAESILHFPAGPDAAHEFTVLGNSPLQVLTFHYALPGQTDGLTRLE